MKYYSSTSRGFTLIELLVVMAIIGLLASIISVSLVSARAKGRDAKRIADIRTIQLALETYYNDNQKYPIAQSTLAPTYLPTIPTDPSTGSGYKYSAFNLTSAGTANCGIAPAVKYHLGGAMEDTTNVALSQDNDFTASATYTLCSGSGANFSGKPLACTGTVDVTLGQPDPCYDLTN